MISVGKVKGEQINVLYYSHNKMIVFWLFCIKRKKNRWHLSKENMPKWTNTEWEIN